ncbi:hypothetical protein DFP72DRAFT_841445 [Ephemerocybe angulata]|uniref:Uncharacterized protein n=1 Tax=Ephemerocybe angulata TaxID=980116 RepID=A0A8H6IFD5_9AGAR|nr:hypothetical protein DFP72DRAFT_841445 [Tulosesus angulatus]
MYAEVLVPGALGLVLLKHGLGHIASSILSPLSLPSFTPLLLDLETTPESTHSIPRPCEIIRLTEPLYYVGLHYQSALPPISTVSLTNFREADLLKDTNLIKKIAAIFFDGLFSAADEATALLILNKSRSLCGSEQTLSQLLQTKFFFEHTPFYWVIVNRGGRNSGIPPLLVHMLGICANLSADAQKDIVDACHRILPNDVIFQYIEFRLPALLGPILESLSARVKAEETSDEEDFSDDHEDFDEEGEEEEDEEDEEEEEEEEGEEEEEEEEEPERELHEAINPEPFTPLFCDAPYFPPNYWTELDAQICSSTAQGAVFYLDNRELDEARYSSTGEGSYSTDSEYDS